MTTTRTTISDILAAYFTPELDALTGVRRGRLQLVREHLEAFLETGADRVLVTHDLEILAREREFGTANAFAKTMHADDLVYAISGWVQGQWLLTDGAVRLVQLDTALTLARAVVRQGLANYEEVTCPLLDIQYAVKSGRSELQAAR